jgi:hypothetical protein
MCNEVVTVVSTDNRDTCCTVLTLSNGTTVEVDPIELYDNAIENSLIGEGLDELKRSVMLGDSNWDDIREWDVTDYRNRLDHCVGYEEAEHLHVFVQSRYFGTEVLI